MPKGQSIMDNPEKLTNKCYRMPKGQSIMDNPEKLTTYGTQYEEKHNAICVGHHYSQTNTNNVNKT
jgi:homoserine acetyltransferase